MKKGAFKKRGQQKKKRKGDNLNANEKEQMKKEDKRKKEKRDNLGDNEKEQLRKYEKEGKKVMHDITLMILKKQK